MTSPLLKRVFIACCGFLLIGVFVFALAIFRQHGTDSTRSSPSERALHLLAEPPAFEAQGSEKEDLPAVFGLVEDDVGNPLNGALVRAICIASDVYQYDAGTVYTSEEGIYSHKGLLPNRRYKLAASAPGFVAALSKDFLFEGKPTEIDLVLSKTKSAQHESQKAADDELDVILSGVTSSLENYRSGRMVFTLEIVSSPVNLTGEEIEKNLKWHEDGLRKLGKGEKIIADEIDRFRNWLKKVPTEGSRMILECEYIFKGQYSYSYTFTRPVPQDPTSGIHQERYFRDGTETIITTSKGTDEDNVARWHSWAEVRNSDFHPSRREFQGPLGYLIELRELFSPGTWVISGIEEREGEIVYSIYDHGKPLRSISVEIIPAKGYFIRNIRIDHKRNLPFFEIYQFDNIQWDPSGGVYYPRKIVIEDHNIAKSGEHRIFIKIISLREFEFNIDIPDETFSVPFREGLVVNDFRFDPPKQYIHKYPQAFDEYMKSIDESAKALKNKNP